MKPEEVKNEKLEQELSEEDLDSVAGGKTEAEIREILKNDQSLI